MGGLRADAAHKQVLLQNGTQDKLKRRGYSALPIRSPGEDGVPTPSNSCILSGLGSEEKVFLRNVKAGKGKLRGRGREHFIHTAPAGVLSTPIPNWVGRCGKMSLLKWTERHFLFCSHFW